MTCAAPERTVGPRVAWMARWSAARKALYSAVHWAVCWVAYWADSSADWSVVVWADVKVRSSVDS